MGEGRAEGRGEGREVDWAMGERMIEEMPLCGVGFECNGAIEWK